MKRANSFIRDSSFLLLWFICSTMYHIVIQCTTKQYLGGASMAERLRIIIEFSKNKERELRLYSKILDYSVPSAAVKDMLLGLIPLPDIRDINVTIKEK